MLLRSNKQNEDSSLLEDTSQINSMTLENYQSHILEQIKSQKEDSKTKKDPLILTKYLFEIREQILI